MGQQAGTQQDCSSATHTGATVGGNGAAPGSPLKIPLDLSGYGAARLLKVPRFRTILSRRLPFLQNNLIL
eukprot:5954294-Pleurochrysis_carterae.AAC.1